MDKAMQRQMKDAVLVFLTKTDAAALSDRKIRVKIKALQEVLLYRKQQRAAVKK